MSSEYKVTEKTLTDYQPNPENLNIGTPKGLATIEDSLQFNGVGRSLVASAEGVLIAGNHTQEAAINTGIEKVIEIETAGDAIIVHKRRDLKISDPKAIALGISDNRATQTGLVFDELRLAETLTELKNEDLSLLLSTGFSETELDDLLQSLGDDVLTGTDSDGSDLPLTRYDVPDALFASDNEWGIPTLDMKLQAKFLDLPVTKWGVQTRSKRIGGTLHFYTDDYKFNALWDDPSDLINANPINIVEPNISSNRQMPRAAVLWGVYRKRWLARYAQSYGLRVFVDLNIEREFFDIALLGVPRGWTAYANRAYHDDLTHLEDAYTLATEHAQTDIVYAVIGGRKDAKDLCQARGWLWIAEDSARARGERIASE